MSISAVNIFSHVGVRLAYMEKHVNVIDHKMSYI